ncbi:MAG TPA: pyridoxamine 5'-phosphate oxidase family protein [Gemmatimonadaceae bacterium]|nr:pyridoxamine 5'-phosphate oxidase family protein [Gemmatimonadaceae bacterium]
MKKSTKEATTRRGPTIRPLSREECDDLLERNQVGRLAFTFHDRVDIEPVHYVYADGWLHGRTSPGTKVATLLHHPWVAFEVDEVEGLFDWQSVVVHGAVYILDGDGSAADRTAYESTLSLIRELVPESLERDDPVPGRKVLFRIHVDEVTGRVSTMKGGD